MHKIIELGSLVVNSGCANAVTGKQGMEDAWAMSRAAGSLISSESGTKDTEEALVMSTGVIGQTLRFRKSWKALSDPVCSWAPDLVHGRAPRNPS